MPNELRIYTGKQLKNYIENELETLKNEGVRKSRFCKKELDQYLQNTKSKVCGIYGLRRTGKTTLMYQTIQGMDYEDVVLLRCKNNDNYTSIENYLDNLTQKYIFIDEITKADGFIQLASSLYDNYPDKKIVIAGTDSASILFVKEEELYDRIELIHTTYISYAEFNYLLGKSLDEYIKYGGTLTDGTKIYNNEDNLEDYTNTAIVSNICRSVEIGKEDIQYKRLYSLLLSGELEAAINKTIEKNAKEFSLNIVRSSFSKSNNFGSAKNLMLQSDIKSEDKMFIAERKDHRDICSFIEDKLKMQSSPNIDPKDFELITNFLIKLDVLSKKNNGEIYFTQSGMQYCFAEIIMDNIVNTAQFQQLFKESQDKFIEKLHQDAMGHILENIIQADVQKCPELSKMEIGKVNNLGNGEFDLYIINPETNKAVVYEIKRRFIETPSQYQHLINEEFCSEFERLHHCTIVEKAVIYQGENKQLDNGIKYYNASDYLLNIKDLSLVLSKQKKIEKEGKIQNNIQ